MAGGHCTTLPGAVTRRAVVRLPFTSPDGVDAYDTWIAALDENSPTDTGLRRALVAARAAARARYALTHRLSD